MIVPGSSYWNMGLGREIGDVNKDDEGIRNMKNLGPEFIRNHQNQIAALSKLWV
ncbi:Uncharacterised protein [uncultured archaeon]|nr:Uncharacterised protein [uncultured archaeon]